MTESLLQQRAVPIVHDVLCACAEPLAGLRKALPVLSELFGSRHAAIDRLPLDGGPPELVAILHPGESTESMHRYRAFMVECPCVRFLRAGGFSPVLRISDHCTQEQFEQTNLYREVFLPAGWRDQLGFAVQLPDAALGVTFQREKLFDDDEARLAARMQDCVAERFGTGSRLDAENRFRPAWRLPLDKAGEAVILPAAVRRLLERYFNCSEGEAHRLPKLLQRWVHGAQLRSAHARNAQGRKCVAVDRPHGRLHVELLPSKTGGPEVLCLFEEKGCHDFYRLRELRLTDREIEVLFWIAQGKADGDIAIILGAASRTVSKHMENILVKLSANNRTAAAVRAVEWLADPSVLPGERW